MRDAVAGSTRLGDKGIRDEAITRDGSYLYAIDADAQKLFGWTIQSDGALVSIGAFDGVPRDRRRARHELTEPRAPMRLEPLYRAHFSTPERRSVELDGARGTETQSLLFAQGRCEGQAERHARSRDHGRLLRAQAPGDAARARA